MYSTISISHLAPAPIHYHNNSPPSRQRSASTHSSPAGHRETQPFVPVIQRSADDPSNSRETTSLPTLNQIPTPSTHFPICSLLTCNPSDNPEFLQEESDAICSLLTCNPSRHRHSIPSALKSQPVRRVLSVTDSAGGELLLRRRKSALLQKFSLSERLQTRVREFLKRF